MNKNYRKRLRKGKWKKIRELFYKEHKPVCSVVGCNIFKVDLHHFSYERMGKKDEVNDLIPLCRKHHNQVHELQKKEGLTLLEATNEVVFQ